MQGPFFSHFESWNLAILLLTFIGGLAIANLFRARGVTGCLSYLISIAVLVIIVSGLVVGYSVLIERVTFHLQQYIYYNGIGIVGFILGLLTGVLLRRRR